MRYPTHLLHATSVFVALALGTGCGDAGSDSSTATPNASEVGYVDLKLADNLSDEYKEVNLDLDKVEFQDPDDENLWLPVATEKRQVNVLGRGVKDLIGQHVGLPHKRFRRMRMSLGDGCNLLLKDGSRQILRVPEELRRGLLIDIDVDINVLNLVQVFIDIDIGRCIQRTLFEGKPCYTLRPCFNVYDQHKGGFIGGRLRSKRTGQYLGGQKVYAEAYDDGGRPYIERTAYTDQDGKYAFDGLPLNKQYHVVCHPFQDGLWYQTWGSRELGLDRDHFSLIDIDIDVDIDISLSRVGGRLFPFVDQACDRVELVRLLDCCDGGQKWLIVDDGYSQIDRDDKFEFGNLPKGKYHVQSKRMFCEHGGSCRWSPLRLSADVDVDIAGLIDIDLDLGLGLLGL